MKLLKFNEVCKSYLLRSPSGFLCSIIIYLVLPGLVSVSIFRRILDLINIFPRFISDIYGTHQWWCQSSHDLERYQINPYFVTSQLNIQHNELFFFPFFQEKKKEKKKEREKTLTWSNFQLSSPVTNLNKDLWSKFRYCIAAVICFLKAQCLLPQNLLQHSLSNFACMYKKIP